jgi:hypothetical protein
MRAAQAIILGSDAWRRQATRPWVSLILSLISTPQRDLERTASCLERGDVREQILFADSVCRLLSSKFVCRDAKPKGRRTRQIFATSFSTGTPGDRGALDCHRNATNRNRSVSSAAFYQSLKSKVGLAAAKAGALRINLNVEGCDIVAAPVHAPSRAPLLLPLLRSHNVPLPRVH